MKDITIIRASSWIPFFFYICIDKAMNQIKMGCKCVTDECSVKLSFKLGQNVVHIFSGWIMIHDIIIRLLIEQSSQTNWCKCTVAWERSLISKERNNSHTLGQGNVPLNLRTNVQTSHTHQPFSEVESFSFL